MADGTCGISERTNNNNTIIITSMFNVTIIGNAFICMISTCSQNRDIVHAQIPVH